MNGIEAGRSSWQRIAIRVNVLFPIHALGPEMKDMLCRLLLSLNSSGLAFFNFSFNSIHLSGLHNQISKC